MLAIKLSVLPPSRRRLIALMSSIGFGHIDNLRVEAGQPVLEPALSVTREVKFCAESSAPVPERPDEFALKRQVIELFEQLDQIGTGVIDRLEIRHGLPFRMMVGDHASA